MSDQPTRFETVLPNDRDKVIIEIIGITDVISAERLWMTSVDGEIHVYSLDVSLAYRRDTDVTNLLDEFGLVSHPDLLAMFTEHHFRPVAIYIGHKNMDLDNEQDVQDPDV